MTYGKKEKPSDGLRLSGWAAMALGLPLALLGALAPPNEYAALLGSDALDCDGPFRVYLFAGPALVIYSIALAINGRRWRRALNLAAAILSLVICVGVSANLVRAIATEQAQEGACQTR